MTNLRLGTRQGILVIFLGLGAVVSSALSAAASVVVSATDPRVRALGRVDIKGGALRMDWTATGAELAFEGSEAIIALDAGTNLFNVFLDQKLVAVIGPQPIKGSPAAKLWIAPVPGAEAGWRISAKKGAHRLRVQKRTGPNFGVSTLNGFRLNAGAKLLALPDAPALRLEFIGDSLTNAYGVEGPGKACTDLRSFENSDESYASHVTRALGAQSQIVAFSGYGVVRNWGAKTKTSADPYPTFYPRSILSDASTRWDRSRFKPALSVIFLGSNDFSTEPKPDIEVYITGYLKLIDAVREGRPGLPILCLQGGNYADMDGAIETVVKRDRAKGHNTQLFKMTPGQDAELGCDWHPMAVVHRRWAPLVTAKIKVMLAK